MACACYWGCGTRSNKIVYGVTLLLLITGVALAVAGGVGGSTGKKCFQAYNDCYQLTNDRGGCARVANDYCKYNTYILLILIGIIIFIVGLFFTSWFCCCSQPPKSEGGSTVMPTGAVVMPPSYMPGPTVIVAQPYNPHAPPQPFPAQPVMAQPFDPNAPHGQPIMAQPYQPPQPTAAQPFDPNASHGQPIMAQPYQPPQHQGQPIAAQPFDPNVPYGQTAVAQSANQYQQQQHAHYPAYPAIPFEGSAAQPPPSAAPAPLPLATTAPGAHDPSRPLLPPTRYAGAAERSDGHKTQE